MNFTIGRDALVAPLQAVANVVERRQSLPILSNVLITLVEDSASFAATDMEVESIATIAMNVGVRGSLAVPARKLLDISRALPPGSDIVIDSGEKQVTIACGRSRFTLATLPAGEFPNIGNFAAQVTFELDAEVFSRLIAQTQFAMAQQDVRYYLNGLLFEFSQTRLRAVATDGHRLAMSDAAIEGGPEGARQLIVPRKGVSELARLLDGVDGRVTVRASENHVQVDMGKRRLTSKLIDGKFPDYERVVPAAGVKVVLADRDALKQGLARASILSNEKFRGVRLCLETGVLKALAHNSEQEEAQEEIDVEYTGDDLEIGFNVSYLLDILAVMQSATARLEFTDSNSSCLIRGADESLSKYVVMPMRL